MIQTFEIEQTFVPGPAIQESLDDFLDRVQNELDVTGGGVEADYLANLRTSGVVWTVSLEADDKLEGLNAVISALRAAIQRAQRVAHSWRVGDELKTVVVGGGDLATA